MANFDSDFVAAVNLGGRVGVLASASAEGKPNAAYFGSPLLKEDGEMIMGLGDNRTLGNLEENPFAVFFVVGETPVGFNTPGWRLYLKVKEIDKDGPLLDQVRQRIAEKAGEGAAKIIKAGVIFEVIETRPLVDMK